MFLLDKILYVHYDVTACVKIFDCVVRKLVLIPCLMMSMNNAWKLISIWLHCECKFLCFSEAGYQYEFTRYCITAGFRYMLPCNWLWNLMATNTYLPARCSWIIHYALCVFSLFPSQVIHRCTPIWLKNTSNHFTGSSGWEGVLTFCLKT